jgi:hypothetical protein
MQMVLEMASRVPRLATFAFLFLLSVPGNTNSKIRIVSPSTPARGTFKYCSSHDGCSLVNMRQKCQRESGVLISTLVRLLPLQGYQKGNIK